MTKIEEIIYKVFKETEATDYEEIIQQAMKEYAEWYVNQFREDLLDNGYYDDFGKLQVDIDTIQTLPLQPHE